MLLLEIGRNLENFEDFVGFQLLLNVFSADV